MHNFDELRGELEQLDGRLASLLDEALRLCATEHPDRHAFLIAHAGRELSRGVIEFLAPAEPSEREHGRGREQPTPAERSANRQRIAQALSLDPADPRVTRWFELVDVFAGNNKFRRGASDGAAVVAAFTELCQILFGRLAPYFSAQSEVDRLLDVDAPTPEDVARLRAALGRPSLRRYFYERATSAAWLPVLRSSRLIAPPPPVLIDTEGRTGMPWWPEGEYLLRVGASHPELSAAIVEDLSLELQNLSVWRQAAQLACTLPAPYAARLASRLVLVLQRLPPFARFFSHACLPLVVHLAHDAAEVAYALTEALLRVERNRDAGVPTLRGWKDNAPQLVVLDPHDLDTMVADVFPALIAADERRAVEFFRDVLTKAIRKAPPTASGWRRGISKAWCRDLEQLDRHENDVRAVLAHALLRAARVHAARGVEQAARVLEALESATHEIFRRVERMVLAEIGALAQSKLDAHFCGATFLDEPWGDRESAILTLRQFGAASPLARRLLTRAISVGPSAEFLRAMLTFRGEAEEELPDVEHEVRLWQRARLAWFEDAIPDELRSLAEELGVTGDRMTDLDRRLAYDGFASGGGGWVRHVSPVPDEVIGTGDIEQLLHHLLEWSEPPERASEGPSLRGLLEAVERVLPQNPARLEELARRLARLHADGEGSGRSIEAVSALLRAAGHRPDGSLPVAWVVIFELVGVVVSAPMARESSMHELLLAFLRLVAEGARQNQLKREDEERLWQTLPRILPRLVLDEVHHVADVPHKFGDLVQLSVNHPAGVFTRTVLEVALCDYRRAREHDPEKVITWSPLRFTPILDQLLTLSGPAALASHVQLGAFVPQLHLLAPSWFAAARDLLFEKGTTDPLGHPAWGGYLTLGRYYSSMWDLLRPWYAAAVEGLPPESGEGTREFSVREHLLEHLMLATLRGDLPVADEEGLLRRALAHASPAQRRHLYWWVYRGWSDADAPPDPDFVVRLLEHWRQRLEELSREPADARADLGAGLLWLLVTPHLPEREALELAEATLDVSALSDHAPDLWGRLGEFARVDAGKALSVFERVVHELHKRPYAYLPAQELAPVLRVCLASDVAHVRARAVKLVHWLGEHVSNDYRTLLSD